MAWDESQFKKPSPQELKNKLTALQYKVTQEEGTERAFENEYWDNKKPGLYVDRISGEPLFSSIEKFDSGTGWPSFYKPLVEKNIVTREDRKLFSVRTEVRSRVGDNHLGHVFNDGPQPTGLRYCMNSAALRFIPEENLAIEGYGEFKVLFGQSPTDATPNSIGKSPLIDKAVSTATKTGASATPSSGGLAVAAAGASGHRSASPPVALEKATLAGGCFWGMQHILDRLPGVISTRVGYIGGHSPKPSYRDVTTGQTGYAEAVEITFDPQVIRYEKLLSYFWRMHDPTQLNRQGVDVGTQYRSAIFYHNEKQRLAAEKSKAEFDKSGVFKAKAVTQISPATEFYEGEDYHQKYFDHHPERAVCHTLRER